MKKIILIIVFQLLVITLMSQNYKFGKVSIEEMQEKYNPLDSSAVATILHHNERIFYQYDSNRGFYKQIDVAKRIKIYSQEGLEWAKHSVVLYDETSSKREKILSIKAVTYNLERDKIVENKLKKDGIFNEKVNKYWEKVTLALPNVKKGSVIELKYTIVSPFVSSIPTMNCQETVPIKNFDYQVKIPEYFRFKTYLNPQALVYPKLIKSVSNNTETEVNLTYKENVYIIKDQNIPALRDEVYVSNLDNYRSKLSYELESIRSFNYKVTNYSSDWNSITKKIYDGSSFGDQLKKSNYYKEDIDQLLTSVTSENEKIIAIFNFVKSKVKWNEYKGYNTDLGVKSAFKEGEGNVADINLMLISMLRYAGIDANPILVSTKSNGIPLFPTREGFNYVICGIEKENDVVFLDATRSYTTVNILPKQVLNWQGRLVREHGSSTWVSLFPKQNSISTKMLTVAMDKDLVFKGKVREQKTNYFGFTYRKKHLGLAKEELKNELIEDKGEIEISNFEIKNEKMLNKPVLQSYDFVYEGVDEIGNEVYIDPLLFFTSKTNIFNEEERLYNIDFNFPWSNKNILSLKIPEGYKIKSMPESIKLKMSDNLGSYSFLIKQNGNVVQVSELMSINFPIVPALYYTELKEIYKALVEKNLEKIVLEKV